MSLVIFDSFNSREVNQEAYGIKYQGIGMGVNSGRLGTEGSANYNSGGNLGCVVPSRTTYGLGCAVKVASAQAVPLFWFGGDGGITSSSGTPTTWHIIIYLNANMTLSIYRGGPPGVAANTLIATSAAPVMVIGAYIHLEVKVVLDDVAGSVDIRAEGVTTPVLSFTGDTKNGGTSGTIDSLGITSGSQGNNGTCFDDFYVWNTDGTENNDWMGDLIVGIGYPDADGTYTNGTAVGAATKHQCVDEQIITGSGVPSDTDYVELDDTALPKKVSFTVPDAGATVGTIKAVKFNSYARKDNAGTNTHRVALKSGATEDDGGADKPTYNGYVRECRYYEHDPATAAAWTNTGYNAIELVYNRVA